MPLFPTGHATHPQWRMAAALAVAQLRAQMARPQYARGGLGLLYITDRYAGQAGDILDYLAGELPEVADWAGTVGVGIVAGQAEYIDEPALAVMLCALPSTQYRVFSGVAPLPPAFAAHTALVHADGGTPDVAGLVAELAGRTETGYLFGGLASTRGRSVQFAASGSGNMRGQGAAGAVFSGGLSGVAFGPQVALVSRVTQGCTPVAGAHAVTAAEGNVVTALDGEPALQVLLRELGVDLSQPREALAAVRATLAGLQRPGDAQDAAVRSTGNFGSDVLVRHIIGLDPAREGVALADTVEAGMQLAFCRRHAQAARADLMRICAEIREELEPAELTAETAAALAGQSADTEPHPARRIAGALYVSCTGRGGPHFGTPNAEMQIVRHALGDVPLVGFFAAGEIARGSLYGYTGVLTVFVAA
ncbi:FIST signal transduction protein [Xylophilus sp.]|uniref:FIST signal transduction protein n=1 Tax=Xylophilus sp. TaxID=2653893 RepID=UPI0013BCAE36|nr:FIST C-terminal domain-containing protein [Xylophilus sp.]KAF1044153.1 MAG: hypothetical protein GAK38_03679 [Xylophilus sp.]